MQASDLNPNPMEQFLQWYDDASAAGEVDVNAMALATATKSGIPSVRYVLYKGIDQDGFLMYTNFNSRKATEIFSNPVAAIAFYWAKLLRQVRIEGQMQKLSAEKSQQYFRTRARDSQLGAWSSAQSSAIANRQELLDRYTHFKTKFHHQEVPCPEFWGGFRLIPTRIEFWQGQEYRLSDRFCYQYQDGKWEISCLAP